MQGGGGLCESTHAYMCLAYHLPIVCVCLLTALSTQHECSHHILSADKRELSPRTRMLGVKTSLVLIRYHCNYSFSNKQFRMPPSGLATAAAHDTKAQNTEQILKLSVLKRSAAA